MELKNASGDHIKKEKTSLSGFICIRLRERRPGLLLHFAKPGHLDVPLLFTFLLIFSSVGFPRPPSQAPHPRLRSEEG